MQRTCDSCGENYEAKRATSKFCSSKCRVNASRGHLNPAPAPSADPDAVREPLSATLVGATKRDLEEAGRLDTWLGQQALALAQVLASGRGTPAGLAAASRELRETMSAALRGAGAPTSALLRHRDELAARRARGA